MKLKGKKIKKAAIIFFSEFPGYYYEWRLKQSETENRKILNINCRAYHKKMKINP